MTSTNGITLSDLLNCASEEGVDEAIGRYGLPASAAGPLSDWLKSQDRILDLEQQVVLATRIADDIADEKLRPLFNTAMEAA